MTDATLQTLINALATILASIFAVVLGHILTKRATRVDKDQNAHIPEKEAILEAERKGLFGENVSVPKLLAGFAIAIGASVAWGIGNVVTRHTAIKFPSAGFDIALLHYFSGSLALILAGLLLKGSSQNVKVIGSLWVFTKSKPVILAATFKAFNTYCWIAAVILIPAGYVATLENMHVVWTMLILILFYSITIPSAWFTSAIIVLIGVSLILGVGESIALTVNSVTGLTLAGISGLAFSGFALFWSQVDNEKKQFWQRCIETGIVMLVSGLVIWPIHATSVLLFNNGNFLPFLTLSIEHVFLQLANGALAIGVTYLLINEALTLMKGAGKLSVLLLGLGISFAVLFTMIGEAIWFGNSITLTQWIGVFLFSVGFSAVRNSALNTQN